jgi:hypothetical protein
MKTGPNVVATTREDPQSRGAPWSLTPDNARRRLAPVGPLFLVLRATRQPSSRVRSFWSPAPSLMVSRGGCPFCSPLYGVHRDGKSKKRAPMTPINPADEFLKHAAECQQMAKATRNPASKATWNRMAVRWLQCAERAKNQKVATRARVPVRRQAEISSAHY